MGNFIIKILNVIISMLGNTLSFILSVLPPSPFSIVSSLNSSVSNYLDSLGWIIPFGTIILLLESWVGAILVYYVYQIVMRYIKVIS